MKFLRKFYFALIYLLPAILFFSYYPIISFGSDATMNFELSLPLIWLVIFDIIVGLVLVMLTQKSGHTSQEVKKLSRQPSGGRGHLVWPWQRAKDFGGLSDRKFFLFALFPLYATCSIFWSANPLRAVLTAGIIWLIFVAAFALLYITPLLEPSRNFSRHLIGTFFISTAIICIFCWLQCALDVIGVARENTLLCLGCTSWTFGFPHPSGFAIEPQYMGNLLLAPTFLALYLLAFRQGHVHRGEGQFTPSERRWLLFFASFFSMTLFLTLSRGAIYAYFVAIAILLIFVIAQHSKRDKYGKREHNCRWQPLIFIPVATFFCTLVAQGIFATVSPTSDTFLSGTSKVIHQLSLGIIDFRPREAVEPDCPVENPVENSQTIGASQKVSEIPKDNSASSSSSTSTDSRFDGYIPESTNVRLGLSLVGLQTWLEYPIFGVGLGGAGVAISRAHPENALAVPNAIIQNEPISLLLELGSVGIALILLAFWLAFGKGSDFWKNPDLPFFCALILAYFVTLQFFSGPANALQIYLMPPLLYMVLTISRASNQPLIDKNAKSRVVKRKQ